MELVWSILKNLLGLPVLFPWSVFAGMAILFCLYWVYNYLTAPFRLFRKLGIKGPTPSIFFGNFNAKQKLGLMKFIEVLYQEYGPVAGYYLGRDPNMMIADLDILKQIMVKEFDTFMDRPPFPDLIRTKKNSPRGLLTSRGEVWKVSRQTLSPSFSASKMKMVVPLIQRSTEALHDNMKESANCGNSADVFKMFGAFTMETIVAIAFGRVVDIQRGENDELTNAANRIFRGAEEGNKTSLSVLLPLLSYFPFLENILRIFISRSSRGLAFKTLQEAALSLVKTRRESRKQGKYKDLLQLMLDASVQEDESEGPSPSSCPAANKVLSDEQIVAHSVTFLLAGYETTANTLAYTAYLLSLNPDVQDRLQQEIDSYFEDKSEVNLYEATQEIDYLEMVIQESLRLYPPATFTTRYCKKTVTINGVTIQKDVAIVVPIALLHKSPKHWKDPEIFDPDRFTTEEKAKRPQLCYMPFGFGPRSCIGMRFAMLEAKLALIEVLRKFTFVRSPETEVPLQTVLGITMAPKNGIFLKIVSRD